MTIIVVTMLVVGYLLIATGHITGVNKAAIAMFVGTIGWVVYIIWGADFVGGLHATDYLEYLAGAEANSDTVKYFIRDNAFIKYVGRAAAVVMFLLATMSIVEILNNNGCFDFIKEWATTRKTVKFVWIITLCTFVVSANLDNLTTTTMMLVIMHSILQNRRQRMLIGTAIVLAANCGGCFTVIGDPIGLILWEDGAISASRFSAYMFVPALVAWVVPTLLIAKELPDRLDVELQMSAYRGDDTNLNRWQRFVMLIVGIGGLWFIPTFHNITKLSPFLGALCVLSVLWVVNEAFNRKLMDADQMAQRRFPRALQYGAIQQLLFVMGIMLGMGVMLETGVFGDIAGWLDTNVHNIWVFGIFSGVLSSIVDTFTIAISDISLYHVVTSAEAATCSDKAYAMNFVANGDYWKVISFCTAVGGCLLSVGSTSGLALMRMEHIRFGWYLKNISWKVLCGWLAGLVILFVELYII